MKHFTRKLTEEEYQLYKEMFLDSKTVEQIENLPRMGYEDSVEYGLVRSRIRCDCDPEFDKEFRGLYSKIKKSEVIKTRDQLGQFLYRFRDCGDKKVLEELKKLSEGGYEWIQYDEYRNGLGKLTNPDARIMAIEHKDIDLKDKVLVKKTNLRDRIKNGTLKV